VTVNSEPLPREGQLLRSGDQVRAANSTYLVIVGVDTDVVLAASRIVFIYRGPNFLRRRSVDGKH
jgi:hypothetical protein